MSWKEAVDGCVLKSPVRMTGAYISRPDFVRLFRYENRSISANKTWIWASRTSSRFGLYSKCVVHTQNTMSGLELDWNFVKTATFARSRSYKDNFHVSTIFILHCLKTETHRYFWLKEFHAMKVDQMQTVGAIEYSASISVFLARSLLKDMLVEAQPS